MSLAKKALSFAAVLAIPAVASAATLTLGDVEAIYEEWLQDYADRRPADAIARTSDDFIMVNNQTVMDRAEALAFTEAVAGFIVSRECTNAVVANKELPGKSHLLLSRVDCTFHTIQGDLPGHFLETIIVDKQGVIVYDHFADVANPSLP
jgi:hypothetical protein